MTSSAQPPRNLLRDAQRGIDCDLISWRQVVEQWSSPMQRQRGEGERDATRGESTGDQALGHLLVNCAGEEVSDRKTQQVDRDVLDRRRMDGERV